MLAYFNKLGELIFVPDNDAEHYLIENNCFDYQIEDDAQKAERIAKEEVEAPLWVAPDYESGIRWADQNFPSKIGEVTCKTNMESP
jgi:hypothetical protein